MADHARGTNKTSFIFPFAVFGMVFGTWVVLRFIEACVLQWDESQIHCGQSILYYSSIACFVAVLAGFLAEVTRAIYFPVLVFPTQTSELPSALFASFVMAVVFHGLIRGEFYFPSFAGNISGWLGVSLLVCGMLLIIVNHCSRRKPDVH